jgi:hypothetical protein
VLPELFARAKKLRWICASRAGLGGAWFYEALVKSDVVVTACTQLQRASLPTWGEMLAFARRFEHYRLRWRHSHSCSAHR